MNKLGRKEDDDAHNLEGICWGLHVVFFTILLFSIFIRLRFVWGGITSHLKEVPSIAVGAFTLCGW